ncbi:MAG: Na(+)/H(+) antiporter subunit B [Thiobacillus sp.]|nr:Na(+)/H(+) antiporter subunit B [Thiobacillus sp.]
MSQRSPVLERAALPVYWAMLAVALFIFLRGHNEPGGGFIGGLVAVAASALLAIVLGPVQARRRQPLAPLSLAMAGVGLALLSGVPALFAGLPYLTHLWAGGLSTVLLFDLGVFCVVWGSLTGYLYSLLEEGRT